jgi:hypothetical protein
MLLESAGQPPSPVRRLVKRVYDILGWLTVQLTLNYIVASFLLLHLAPSLTFFNRVWWYGDVLVAASFGFFKLGGPKKLAAALGITLPAPVKREARPVKAAIASEDAVQETVRDATSAGLSDATTEKKSDVGGSPRPSIIVHPPAAHSVPELAAPKPADLLAASAPGVTTQETPASTPASSEEADWEIIGDNKKTE